MIRRVVTLLGSLRLTLVLILSLAALFLLGLWIPQKSLLQRELYLKWKASAPVMVAFLEQLGLTDIYISPFTLLLWALFFLNLALVMGKRVSVIRRKISVPDFGSADTIVSGKGRSSAVTLEGTVPGIAANALRKAGYRVHGTDEHFVAVKNRLSPLATLLFHISFFLMLLGGIVGMYTKFSGVIDLAEGETFLGEPERYQASPRIPPVGAFPSVAFTVKRIEPQVTDGTATQLRVIFSDSRGKDGVSEVNQPYRQGRTIFVIKNIGVAPLCVLTDKAGREIDGAYVKLDVLSNKQDSFSMGGLDFDVRFYPDYVLKDGVEGTRSQELKNPVLLLHVQRGKRFITRTAVGPGGSVDLGGYRFAVPEMRYWVRLIVVRERGEGILYAGFALAALALIWRLVLYRREVRGSLEKREDGSTVLVLVGRAEFFQALYEDEFERLKQRIVKNSRQSRDSGDSFRGAS